MCSSINLLLAGGQLVEKLELFIMTKKKIEFKEGDAVVASPKTMQCPNKSGQLISRTGLTAQQLQDGTMHVTQALNNGQLHIKHPRLKYPFIVHSKFIVPCTASV